MKTITFPADVYDTFEFATLAFNGIGKDDFLKNDSPCCIWGYADFVIEDHNMRESEEIWRALSPQISTITNDLTVESINNAKGLPLDTRVTWEEYCKELNIVRGS